ncbi:50S ribosomal protein L25 [Acidobacteriota bacterium]
MATIAINGEMRDAFGKNASRKLRREGKVPAVLYGAGIESVSLTLNKNDLFSILKSESGENTIFVVNFSSDSQNVMIKSLQTDPVSDELLHTDLIHVAMDKMIKVTVPIVLVGEAVGVKTEGGFVDFISRDVDIECMPKNIPDSIEVDISGLHLHQSLKIEDLAPPEGVKFMSDPTSLIVLLEAPTKEEEVIEVEEELEEGEEVAEEGAAPKEKPEESGEEQ